MNQQELFILANQTLKNVIAQIKNEQLDLVIPDELSWRPNQTVRAVMNIYAYEDMCVRGVLDAKEKFLTNDEFKEDLLKEDPQANYTKYNDDANLAAKNLNDPNKIVHISYGDFPAREYLRDITIQRGLGAYDLATFLKVDTKLPDELVEGLWEIISPIAENLRQYGVFKAKVEVPENASLQDRLIGLTGRPSQL